MVVGIILKSRGCVFHDAGRDIGGVAAAAHPLRAASIAASGFLSLETFLILEI